LPEKIRPLIFNSRAFNSPTMSRKKGPLHAG
jgi:hypothetical protein